MSTLHLTQTPINGPISVYGIQISYTSPPFIHSFSHHDWIFADFTQVLELGSGTGLVAIYFALKG